MPNLPISGLPSGSVPGTSDLLVAVQSGVTNQLTTAQLTTAVRNSNTALTASNLQVSESIVPFTAQEGTLGTADLPWGSIYVSSGSIFVQSDIPGQVPAELASVDGDLSIRSAGFSLLSGSTKPVELKPSGRFILKTNYQNPDGRALLEVIGNLEGSQSFAVNPGTIFQTTAYDGETNRTIFDSYGTGVYSQLNLRRADGTVSAPLSSSAGLIGRIGVSGYLEDIGFGIPGVTGLPARIDFRTTGYSSGSRPTEIWFHTTPEDQLDSQGEYAVKIKGNNDLDVSGSLTASLTQDYVWIGDANNRNTEISASGLATYLTSSFITPSQTGSFVNTSYGLYNQTGSGTPIVGASASIAVSGSLLDGGVGTLTVPANGFSVGDAYHARLAGKITIANNHDLDIHFDAGSTTLVDAGPITMAGSTNKNWALDVTFIIQNTGSAGTASILSSGELTVRTDSANDVVTEIFSSINNTTFDTTISNTLSITGILDAACGTSENIYSELFVLHKIY